MKLRNINIKPESNLVEWIPSRLRINSLDSHEWEEVRTDDLLGSVHMRCQMCKTEFKFSVINEGFLWKCKNLKIYASCYQMLISKILGEQMVDESEWKSLWYRADMHDSHKWEEKEIKDIKRDLFFHIRCQECGTEFIFKPLRETFDRGCERIGTDLNCRTQLMKNLLGE